MTRTSKTILKRMLPRPVYEKLKRYALYGVSDAMDALRARREPLVPPKRMIFVGGTAFKRIGDEYLGHFIEHGGLERGDSVLDLGCGIGRMARPLTAYLDRSARYEGIDIDRSGIEWCRANISPRFPNFHFQLADVYNKHYNPRGRQRASGYRLPFPDETFDFVFLTSVFTHMYPEDVAHYLEEIGRVSKVGGRSLITYFLLNEESARLTREGKSHIGFVPMTDSLYVRDRDVPEDATAFPESWVRAAYGRVGLHIREPVQFGSWCGRRDSLSFQDIVVAEKRPPSQKVDPPAGDITRTDSDASSARSGLASPHASVRSEHCLPYGPRPFVRRSLLRRGDWWRWGRVELPVQDLQPETTTSVSDGLSSSSAAGIGTVGGGPATSPFGLCSGLRDATPERIPAA